MTKHLRGLIREHPGARSEPSQPAHTLRPGLVPDMTRIITTDTPGFMRLARDAHTHGRNRNIGDPSCFGEGSDPLWSPGCRYGIDPLGLHLGFILLTHEHINGQPAPPHYRTLWNVKMIGEPQPRELLLDVSIDVYEEAGRALAGPYPPPMAELARAFGADDD